MLKKFLLFCRFSTQGLQLVKRKDNRQKQFVTLTNTNVKHLRIHMAELTKAMINEEAVELPLVNTGLKTIRLEKFDYNGKWYAGFMTYVKKNRSEVNGKFSMNVEVDILKSIFYNMNAIEEAMVFFANLRRERASAQAPAEQLSNRALRNDEMLVYQWLHIDSLGAVVRTGPSGFWFEDMCLEHGQKALPERENGETRVDVIRRAVVIPNQLDLTRDCACLLLYLQMRKKNQVKPCPECVASCTAKDVTFPCIKCLMSDIPKARYWRTEPEFRQIFSSPEFENSLKMFLEYLRKNACVMRLYGRDLAAAVIKYSNVADMKALYWQFLEKNQERPLLRNLRHCIIEAHKEAHQSEMNAM